jgi:hypothetical protein
MKQTDRLALALGLSVLAASFPLAAQQKLTVVSLPLAQELVKIFPDISSGSSSARRSSRRSRPR